LPPPPGLFWVRPPIKKPPQTFGAGNRQKGQKQNGGKRPWGPPKRSSGFWAKKIYYPPASPWGALFPSNAQRFSKRSRPPPRSPPRQERFFEKSSPFFTPGPPPFQPEGEKKNFCRGKKKTKNFRPGGPPPGAPPKRGGTGEKNLFPPRREKPPKFLPSVAKAPKGLAPPGPPPLGGGGAPQTPFKNSFGNKAGRGQARGPPFFPPQSLFFLKKLWPRKKFSLGARPAPPPQTPPGFLFFGGSFPPPLFFFFFFGKKKNPPFKPPQKPVFFSPFLVFGGVSPRPPPFPPKKPPLPPDFPPENSNRGGGGGGGKKKGAPGGGPPWGPKRGENREKRDPEKGPPRAFFFLPPPFFPSLGTIPGGMGKFPPPRARKFGKSFFCRPFLGGVSFPGKIPAFEKKKEKIAPFSRSLVSRKPRIFRGGGPFFELGVFSGPGRKWGGVLGEKKKIWGKKKKKKWVFPPRGKENLSGGGKGEKSGFPPLGPWKPPGVPPNENNCPRF